MTLPIDTQMKNKSVKRVIVWFSAGVSSAVAAKLTIEKYKNIYPIELVNTDTGSEHPDNFRFIADCEKWLGYPVKILKNPKYKNTIDVYLKDRYLVGVAGARCSLVLKKQVRQKYENLESDLQVFGFDYSNKEQKRATRFLENNPLVMAEFPLIDAGYKKKDCHRILFEASINRPITYDMGFTNANCIEFGCVKGQMGYWNHVRRVKPEAFWNMAKIERILDVAICKKYIKGERIRVFLDELDPDDGNYKTEPPIQCGLFCGEI